MSTEGVSGEWELKRRRTTCIYMLFYFLTGIERSANTPTLWIYIKTMMKTSQPELIYGFINTSIYLAPIFISPFIARIGDKSRNIKLVLTIICITAIVGNVLYLIPSSVFYPITGKFLNGFVTCGRPLIVGEMARIYSPEDLQTKLPLLFTSSAIGFALGPCIVSIFIHIRWKIGLFVITYGNISGVILLLLTLILLVLHLVFSSNLSMAFDLKAFLLQDRENTRDGQEDEGENTNDEQINEKTERNTEETSLIKVREENKISLPKVFFMIFSNVEMITLFLFTLFVSYLSVALFRYMPILMLSQMKLNELAVNGWFLSHALLIIVLLGVAVKFNMMSRHSFYYAIASSFQTILLDVILFILMETNYGNNHYNITVVVTSNVLYTGIELTESVFLVVVTAKLVKPDKQCFVESLRLACKHIGSIIGALTSAFIAKHLLVFTTTTSIFSVFICCALFKYRYLYKEPFPIV